MKIDVIDLASSQRRTEGEFYDDESRSLANWFIGRRYLEAIFVNTRTIGYFDLVRDLRLCLKVDMERNDEIQPGFDFVRGAINVLVEEEFLRREGDSFTYCFKGM